MATQNPTEKASVTLDSLLSTQPSENSATAASAYIDHDRLMDCIHCGLCLSQCPTYAEEGLEADSPRGRIYIMRSWVEGRAEPTPALVEHLDLCLGCRACETACPSGVQYGHLLEGTRQYLLDHYERPRQHSVVSKLIESTFPYPDRLEVAMLPIRLLRRTGVLPLLRKTGVMKLFGYLGDLESLLPPLPPMRRRRAFPVRWKARGQQEANVGMITGCVMPVMLTSVNEATARVLCKAGCSVAAPRDQVCCGALHAHAGDLRQAREFAKKNIEVFEKWQQENDTLDAIIINAAGCGAALKEYSHWFKDDPQWSERAKNFSDKVHDISEFLAGEPYKTRLEALMPQPPAGHSSTTTHRTPRDIPREVIPNTPGATTVANAAGQEVKDRRANWEESLDAGEAISADEATDGRRPQEPHRGPQAGLANSDEIGAANVVERSKQRVLNAMTYHDACHLAHGQGVRTQPRELLSSVQERVPEAELRPLAESEMCCGSAGIYNITQPEMAMRLLDRKMKHIAQTGAHIVVTGNPGCAMQLMLGAKKFNVPVEVRHPVEVLDAATGKNAAGQSATGKAAGGQNAPGGRSANRNS